MGTSLPPVGVRFQAEGVQQTTAAFQQVASAGQRAGQQVSRTFVTAQGTVSAFGRQSVQVLNATGFAVSQLAATGRVGFRELSSSAAGFAAFFGPAGLIASGVISLGLVLADFWQRQRKEIDETGFTINRALDAARARRERDDPLGMAAGRLRSAQAEVARARAEFNQFLRAEQTLRAGGASDATIAELRAKASRKVLDAMNAELEMMRQLTDAVDKNVSKWEQENRTKTKVETTSKDATRALEQEIAALSALGQAQQLTTADFARALDLHRQYATAVRDGTRALLERADALSKERALETAIAIPPVSIRTPIGTTTGVARGPAGQITINPTAARRLAAPAVDQFHTQGITSGFGEAFAQSLQTGLAAGVTSFVASGSIEGMWNTVGSAIVAGLATINPWLAVAGGILQGAISSLFGGRDSRPLLPFQPLPIDIRRVISDPNPRASVRAPRPQVVQVIGVRDQRVQRALALSAREQTRRGLR